MYACMCVRVCGGGDCKEGLIEVLIFELSLGGQEIPQIAKGHRSYSYSLPAPQIFVLLLSRTLGKAVKMLVCNPNPFMTAVSTVTLMNICTQSGQ